MRISSRFSIAVHLLWFLAVSEGSGFTSECAAGSIGVNAVVVRNIIGLLRRAGLVRTQQGAAGAELVKSLAEINLLDVYKAVETNDELFTIHPNPNLACAVGSQIQGKLETVFGEAQHALEARLAAITMRDLVGEFNRNCAD